MPEPITTTVIVTLAATKFIEGISGELSKRFTPAALEKMTQLWKTIKGRFHGKKPNAETTIAQIESGNKVDIDKLAKYLDAEMLDDDEFAAQLREMAKEIEAGKIEDNRAMQQTVIGDHNTNIQAQAQDGGTNYNAGTMYFGTPPKS